MATLVVVPSVGDTSGSSPNDGDGYTRRTSTGSWASVQSGNGTSALWTVAASAACFLAGNTVPGLWDFIQRSYFQPDASALNTPDIISAATFTVTGTDVKYNSQPWSPAPDLNLYGISGAVIGNSGYETCQTTPFSTAISMASWSTSSTNDFALVAAGIAAISKTVPTRFCLRNANYDVANTEPASGAGDYGGVVLWTADHGSAKPTLTITYSTPTSGSAFFGGAW